ncbi:2-amino-3,7-dideoxy-D-threo-hept-6-ulosonate synthase [Amycolatopsis alba]|uniref:Fructose-bisphosphate aldolase n=1 Tax=Amycolatopsis alba DSM 44262 TaxID=1125972 RepID=A0A229S7Q5_AMYAL|nr:2-amino-3,7-dideoxy-D-threo-hept-6-ulosonate synthase [Amycolatopsis alba]OXM54938.1 fructose-bisphosphate aldolase [Amycolatopsis alba DSM 44262]
MTVDGKALRMRRLSRTGDGKHLFVPLDHSVSDGPVVGRSSWEDLVSAIAGYGADAVVLHKGRARVLAPTALGSCGLVVHLSASTAHAADTDAKVLVGDVEDALRLGADAVSVHVNIGSDTESRQLADLGLVAGACQRWGIPLLAMIYPRGPRIPDPREVRLLSHAVNIAADLGADLVKTSAPADPARMAEVVESCPIPVLCAGGAPDVRDLVKTAAELMAAGCAGLAVGRRIFTSDNPAAVVARLASVVHATDPASLSETLPPLTAGVV